MHCTRHSSWEAPSLPDVLSMLPRRLLSLGHGWQAEQEFWAREAAKLRLQQEEWVAARQQAEKLLKAEHARLDAILAAKHLAVEARPFWPV